jgi:hypothetical protein
VRPILVVLFPPATNNLLGFTGIGEHVLVQAFLPQFPVKALDVRDLPRTPWLNIDGPAMVLFQPLLHRLGDELRPVVTADVGRQTSMLMGES